MAAGELFKDVQGPPEDVVVEEDYQQGKSFKVED